MSSDQSSDVPGSIPSILAEVDDKTFEQEDWNVVIRECASLAARWKHLSGFLGLPSTVIDQIQCDHPNDSSSCWNEALNQWIKQNYNTGKFGKPSWKTLLGAIEHVDRCLFKKLASEHKNHGSSSVASEHQSQIRIDEDNLIDDGDLVEKDSTSKEQEEPSKVVAKPNILDDCIVSNHQLTFPCLDVKEMSKEKQKELHQRLYVESVEMMEKFQSLLSEVTKSLKRRAISKNSILCHLMGLGQLRPVYEDPPLPVFRRQLHDLKKAKDIDEVMLGIGDYCSFFNFQLIEQIILKLGTDHDRDKLAKYKQDFHVYAMRKVFECPSEVSSTNSNGLIKLYITLDDTYDNCTVSHLQLFIGKLQKILNIPSVLILHRIESGSIKLTFLLLYDQYLHITFPLSKEQTEALLREGVIYFSCEDHNFSKVSPPHSLKEQTEYPKQKLLHQLNPPMDGRKYLQDDLLLLAYECRQSNLGGWSVCQHPYCAFIRQMSQHFNNYYHSFNHTCERCSHFAEMLNKHISSCTNTHCSVPMCRATRQQQQLYPYAAYPPSATITTTNASAATMTAAQFQFEGSHHSAPVEKDSAIQPAVSSMSMSADAAARPGMRLIRRSSSFTSAERQGQLGQGQEGGNGYMSMLAMILSKGVPSLFEFSSLIRANLRVRAEEIVNRLDREEPLLSDDVQQQHQPSSLLTQQNQQLPPLPPIPPNTLSTHPGPMSLSSSNDHHQQMVGGSGGQQQSSMMSPITKLPGNEDISPSCPSVPPLSHNNSQPQFSSFGSTGLHSGEFDGPGGQTSMATSDSAQAKLSSMKEQSTVHRENPKQKMLHALKSDYLTVGEDGCYYKIRDYNLNETDLLGSGGFGSCLWAQDNTTGKMFAIKQNKNESFKSIEDECHVLSRLADNDYIIKFLGAVIDEGELPTQPPLVCKMMMELAENGNLSEMLKDEYGEEAPLPQDQSLYYLQQILEGVNFLHQTENVLVFDGGRTTKLTDFGTAVAVGEVTSMQGLKGLTPYFAAPEVIKGEVPKVSADIWSVLCILIEMLTARYPGHHHVGTNEVAMMFLIGSYVDININHLVPLDRLDVDPEVKQLFIDVLQVDPLSRPTAMELLNRPIISSAVDYGHYFDECYDSEDTEDLEASPAVECDDSIPIADVPQHISLSSSSGGQSLSLHSLGDKVSELPQFPGSNQQLHPDRGSQDSGVMESIVGSSTCTVFEQRLSHQDSGLEDSLAAIAGECSQAGVCIPVHHMDMHIAASVNPYSRQRSSSINKSGGFPSLAFSSLPQQPSPVPDYITVQRSYSFGRRSSSTKRSDSGFRPQNRATSGLNHVAKRHRPNSIHPKKLQRSYSAPSIQEAAYTEVDRVNPMGRPQLRRTSSEVYVDRGPDIDTPEKEKNRMQNLLSGLSLGPTHPPRSSAPIPARRQMSDASIKCDAQSATSSLSGSSTTSNELSDPWPWKQFDDSGNKDESTPPTNESQAFQRIC